MLKATVWVCFEVFDVENWDDAEEKVYKALKDWPARYDISDSQKPVRMREVISMDYVKAIKDISADKRHQREGNNKLIFLVDIADSLGALATKTEKKLPKQASILGCR